MFRPLPSAYTLTARLFRLLDLAGDRKAPRPGRLALDRLEDRLAPAGVPVLAVGAGPGARPEVLLFDADGAEAGRVLAYDPGFTGGVRAALADLDADGVPDLVTAPGPGGGPHVRVFDGATLADRGGFFAYAPDFRGGLTVAAGPVGGGAAGIATGADAGGGPHVRVFTPAGAELSGFFAYAPGFAGGVRVALSADADGAAVLHTAPGAGGGPHVRTFDPRTGAERAGRLAYAPDFRGGLTLAAGDLTGDGVPDLVTAPVAGGGPHVRVWDGATGGMADELMTVAGDARDGATVGVAPGPDGAARLAVLMDPAAGPWVRLLGTDLSSGEMTEVGEVGPLPEAGGWRSLAAAAGLIVSSVPTVRIRGIDEVATEGAGTTTGLFRVERTGDLSRDLKVTIGLGGTAKVNVDYVFDHPTSFTWDSPDALTVTFPRGTRDLPFRVHAINDDSEEEGDTAQFTLVRAAFVREDDGDGGTAEVKLADPRTADVFILDGLDTKKPPIGNRVQFLVADPDAQERTGNYSKVYLIRENLSNPALPVSLSLAGSAGEVNKHFSLSGGNLIGPTTVLFGDSNPVAWFLVNAGELDGDTSALISIAPGSGYTVGPNSSVTVALKEAGGTITAPPGPSGIDNYFEYPATWQPVQIVATDPDASEDGDWGEVVVTYKYETINAKWTPEDKTKYVSVGGTAVPGTGKPLPPEADYPFEITRTRPDDKHLYTFDKGGTTYHVRLVTDQYRVAVRPVDDDRFEYDEYVDVAVAPPGPGGYFVSSAAANYKVRVSITDNDRPVISVGELDWELAEQLASTGAVAFGRANDPWLNAPLTFGYEFELTGGPGRATYGDDYIAYVDGQALPAAGQLTFAAGQKAIEVLLVPVPDADAEPTEGAFVRLLPLNTFYRLGNDKAGFGIADWTPVPAADPFGLFRSPGCDCGCQTCVKATPANVNEGKELDGAELVSAPNPLSKHPVRYHDGVLEYVRADLWADGFGRGWGVSRMWSNTPGYSAGSFFGNGWNDAFLPFLLATPDERLVVAVANGTETSYFDWNELIEAYTPRLAAQDTLAHDKLAGLYTLTTPDGEAVRYHDFDPARPAAQRGRFHSRTADGVTVAVVAADPAGRPAEVRRTADGLTESLVYEYDAGGRITTVALRRRAGEGPWQAVRSAGYTYYDVAGGVGIGGGGGGSGGEPGGSGSGSGSGAGGPLGGEEGSGSGTGGGTGDPPGGGQYGNLGDLKTATVYDADGLPLETEYYRYYTPGDPDAPAGAVGGLKYALRDASFRRLAAAVPDPLAATDAELAPFADYHFVYDDERRVVAETVGGAGCSACSGGQGTYTYAYTANPDPGHTPGYNTWAVKTVEGRPDGSRKAVYTNFVGAVMLEVEEDPATGRAWPTYHRYDADGRRILTARPSAVTGWDEALPDLVGNADGNLTHVSDTVGVVERANWWRLTTATETEEGGAFGYYRGTSVRNGELGTPVRLNQLAYIARPAGGYAVARETAFTTPNGVRSISTHYAYTWDPVTGDMRAVAATQRADAESGPDDPPVTVTAFDPLGRPAWTKDPAGFLTFTGYDPATGAVVRRVEDVDTSKAADFAGLPAGWATPTGGGLHRITAVEVDPLGRPTKVTHPGGATDYTVYRDADREVRFYPAWDPAALAPTGPTVVARTDAAGRYTETLTMSIAPAVDGAGRPTGAEPVADVRSLSRTVFNAVGQPVAQDEYAGLPAAGYSAAEVTLGTEGVNYLRTRQKFSQRGLPDRTQTPAGTVLRTEYDGLGRVVSEWVGTDDTPAVGFWSPANLVGTDMVRVAAYEYDGGGVGDGHLTRATASPGHGRPDLVTEYVHDWRGRPVAVKEGAEAVEDEAVNRPLTFLYYDNLGNVTETRVYDGDGVAPSLDAPADTRLRAFSVVSYDNQGRAYRTDVYGVDQQTGEIAAEPTTARVWFDARGLPAKTLGPDGLAEKTVYDGLGRPVAVYRTDAGGDGGPADALTLAGDAVWQQAEFGYDAADDLVWTATYDRVAGDTGTGPLTAGTARASYAGFYYDPAGRLLASVDVGTNGGLPWTRPAAVPARSDAALVTSYEYGPDGLPRDVTDPLGVTSRAAYDLLGRVTAVTAAVGTPQAYTATYGYDAGGRLAAVTLPGNRTTGYAYDWLERPAAVTERAGTALARTTATAFDDLGGVRSVTDPAGTVTAYTADVLGRTVSVTAAAGLPVARTVSTGFDPLGRPLAVTDPRGFVTAYGYDDIGRTAAVTDPLGNSWVTAFDAVGRPVASTDPFGKTTTTTYDLLGRPTVVTDPLGHATAFEYTVGGTANRVADPLGRVTAVGFDGFGRPATVTDPLGHGVSTGYDRGGRAVSVTDPNGVVTATAYDPLGRVTAVTEAVGRAEQRATGYAYDALTGDLLTVTDPLGRQAAFAYDPAGRVTGQTLAANTPAAFTVTTAYDLLDRVATVTRPGNRTTGYQYDALSQVTAVTDGVGTPLARTTTFAYDVAGNRTKVTNPLGHETGYTFDKRGLLTHVTDAEGGVVQLGYDKAGRPSFLVDPVNNKTEWQYDAAGRRTAEIDPLGKATAYAYDKAGQLVSVTDRLGRKREFGYDLAGRRTGETWVSAAGATVQAQAFSYDPAGNLLTATDPDGGYTFTYDALNRVATTQQPFGFAQAFTYDAAGNRLTAADNKGGVTTSTFDGLNRLTSRALAVGGVNQLKASWGYDPAGDVGRLDRAAWAGGGWQPAGSAEYGYDALGRKASIVQTDAAGLTVGEYGYVFDAADRVTAQTIDGVTRLFGYDKTGQLVSDGGSALTFDKNGNRAGGGWAGAAGNRLGSGGGWAYTTDAAGQVTGKADMGGAWTYAYDHRGQLVSAAYTPAGGAGPTTAVGYAYDAFGNRVERTANGAAERYAVDGWDPAKPAPVGTEGFDVVADLDGSGAVSARRVFGAGFDEVVARRGGAGTIGWYGADRQGSVRAVFDNAGVAVETAAYDGWGAFLGGVPADRYAYAGREWDAAVGLSHNRQRAYDPAAGRFYADDPLGFAAGDPNLGRYAGNGPTNATDPSGLWSPNRVRQLLGAQDPAVLEWLNATGALLNPTGDADYSLQNYWRRHRGDYRFGWIQGRPDINIPASFTDEEAAAAIIYQTTSTWWGAYTQDFIRWLEGRVQDATLAGNRTKLRDVLIAKRTTAVRDAGDTGKRLVYTYYTSSVCAFGVADLFVRVIEGDVTKWDALAALPLLSLAIKYKVSQLHITDAAGKTHSFDVKYLQQLQAELNAAKKGVVPQGPAVGMTGGKGPKPPANPGVTTTPAKPTTAGEANVALQRPLPGLGSGVHPNLPARNGTKSQGIFAHGGVEVPLQSGVKGPGEYLQSGCQLSFKEQQAATHLEGHAAGIMRRHNIKEADLYINYVGGPCGGYCQPSIPNLLPAGAKLRVHFPKSDGSVGIGVFEGGVPGFKLLK